MMIINGRKLRDEILEDLQKEIVLLPYRPIFCDVLVGAEPASLQYVNMKNKTAEKLGFEVIRSQFPETITTKQLIEEIKKLNVIDRMSGLIVQLPLPEHVDKKAVLDAIHPEIDVDCIGSKNTALFYADQPRFVFPTVLAILRIIETLRLDLVKLKIVIIGKGELVGRPLGHILTTRGCRIEVVDRNTPNIEDALKDADLVISAAGAPGLVRGDMIKKGSVIIDAGTSESYGSILGDVDFESVSKVASFMTSTPGGVGPVTIAMLFSNIVQAVKYKINK